MKIKINNKVSSRMVKRLKWMTVACISVIAVHYIMDSGMESMSLVKFVDAGQDNSHEHDTIY